MPHDWLATKKKFRLLTVSDHKALPLTRRLVYSYLAYRSRYGKGASQAEIARQTGLDRGETVAEAVKSLDRMGLVERTGDRIKAIEPAGGNEALFYPIDGGEHWSQGLAYLWYYPVVSGLTTKENYLLWTLHSLGGVPQNQNGLAKLAGLNRETVRTLLLDLIERDAVSFQKDDGHRFRCRLKEPDPSWFMDRPRKPVGEREEFVRACLTKMGIPKYEHATLAPELVAMPDPVAVIRRAYNGHRRWAEKKGVSRPSHCGKRLRIEIDKHKNQERG
jgi:hypothetical protein